MIMNWTAQVQTKLKQRGFDPGPIDGIPGRKTLAAIKAFQKANGLVVDGIVGPKTSAKLFSPLEEIKGGRQVPPWIAIGLAKVGLHEKLNNKTLKDWLKSDGNTLGDPAVLPWCGDFVETCIALTLPDEILPGNPYWALNWTKFGVPISTTSYGAIAAFTRDGGGHVGFVVGHDAAYYHILGGNQSNAISIAKIAKSRLSGSLRWPSTYPKPTDILPRTSIEATVSTNEA